MSLHSESSSRADFAKLVTGTVVGSVAVAAPALAKSGTGAKQNWFGVVGADSKLGGGMSNYFAESDTDSPYSPYSHGETGLYSADDGAFMLKVKIDVLKDTQKRLQTVPGFIEGKKWEEIRSLLTAKVRLRASAVYLCMFFARFLHVFGCTGSWQVVYYVPLVRVFFMWDHDPHEFVRAYTRYLSTAVQQ